MKLIQKANRQIRVDDDRVDDYLKAGYLEINPETGKLVGSEKAEKPKKTSKKGE